MPVHLLAPELIHFIAQSLNKTKDLKNFRCVCKPIKDAIDPIIFSTIQLKATVFDEGRLRRTVELLEYLAQSAGGHAGGISRYVRTLKIGTLAPRGEYRPSGYHINHDGASRSQLGVNHRPGIDEEVAREYAAKFERYFRPALESLVGVQCVKWEPNGNDLSWTHDEIIQRLGQMQFLSEISIEITRLYNLGVFPLQQIMCNRLCRVSLVCDFSNEGYVYATASIIGRNAKALRRLHLQSLAGPGQQASVIDSILTRYQNGAGLVTCPSSSISPSESSAPLCLKLKLDDLQLPDWFIDSESQRGAALPTQIDFRTLTKLDIDGMSERAWRSLQAMRVRLKYLHVCQINEGLVSYLESYLPGEGTELEELHLQLQARKPASNSNPRLQLTYFFHNVLPLHESTLRVLHIDDKYYGFESGWVIQRLNVEMLTGTRGRYPRLEELNVGFKSDELKPGSPDDIVETLLHFAVSHPSLTHLTIYGVAPVWTGKCGTGRRNRSKRIGEATREAILAARFQLEEDNGDELSGSQCGKKKFLKVDIGWTAFVLKISESQTQKSKKGRFVEIKGHGRKIFLW